MHTFSENTIAVRLIWKCTPELRSGGINRQINVVLLPKKSLEQSSEVHNLTAIVKRPNAAGRLCGAEMKNHHSAFLVFGGTNTSLFAWLLFHRY